jgi:hypothetical protein
MQRNIKSLRKPCAYHVHLLDVPFLENAQNEKLIVYLIAQLLKIRAQKVHVRLTELVHRFLKTVEKIEINNSNQRQVYYKLLTVRESMGAKKDPSS